MHTLDEISTRSRRLLGGVALVAALAGAVVAAAEHWGGLVPCSLCWTQRGILALLMLIALLGFLLWPRRRWGLWVLLGALLTTALGGIAVATRHLYVMWNPDVVDCGMSPEVMLQLLPWREVLIELVTGNTDCAEAAALFGIPLPIASWIGFVTLGGVSVYAILRTLRAAGRTAGSQSGDRRRTG
ncbi:hypothetical protein CKO15_02205 [Halorhodospira abdelmalekii]|uniref:disulfide bond formation protein B n=1 Tax=Halorhodospira abdelmalekii TaxID=421629 RepID=UPI0019043987|nr:disulfide bond formation protein B [Halorhodospira abdelmalekii]MBK1734112.1 hypothetical protein [Halorhodospira abdelmalekii]